MTKKIIEANFAIAATILAYIIALVFEFGYSGYFNYSFEFVSIDIKSLFISLLFTISFIYMFFAIVTMINEILKRIDNIIGMILQKFFITISVFLPFIILLPKSKNIWILCLLIMLICALSVIDDISPKSDEDKKLTIKQRVKKYRHIDEETIKNKGNNKHILLSDNSRAIIAAIFYTLIFTSLAGYKFAEYKGSFYSFEANNKNYVVIRVFGDTVITKEIINNKLSKDTTYFKDNQLNGFTMKRKIINEDRTIKLEN